MIVRQSHTQSWDRFISNLEHDVHGRRVMAYKIMKVLNRNVREAVSFNPIEVDTWKKHYTQLWYEVSEEEEEAVRRQEEEEGKDNSGEDDVMEVDSLTLEELLHALTELKNRKSPGLNGINTELLKYGGILLQLRLLHFLNMC